MITVLRNQTDEIEEFTKYRERMTSLLPHKVGGDLVEVEVRVGDSFVPLGLEHMAFIRQQ
jgi:hypothetical protein